MQQPELAHCVPSQYYFHSVFLSFSVWGHSKEESAELWSQGLQMVQEFRRVYLVWQLASGGSGTALGRDEKSLFLLLGATSLVWRRHCLCFLSCMLAPFYLGLAGSSKVEAPAGQLWTLSAGGSGNTQGAGAGLVLLFSSNFVTQLLVHCNKLLIHFGKLSFIHLFLWARKRSEWVSFVSKYMCLFRTPHILPCHRLHKLSGLTCMYNMHSEQPFLARMCLFEVAFDWKMVIGSNQFLYLLLLL